MRNVKLLLIGLLFAAAYAVAGGAASFVAKKSNTGEFAFSEATQQAFLKDCSENANEWVCGCVLARLQGSYSENEYLKLDAELRKGYQDYDFTSFLSNAVTACDEEYEAAASQITEEEAKAYVDTLLKYLKKRNFLLECSPGYLDLYGSKGANKICGCIYDRMVKDKSRLVQVVLEDGYPEYNDDWGLSYCLECIPDNFTPEIERNFIKLMNQQGIPKSLSRCFLNTIKKEFSLRTFALAARNNKEKLTAMLTMVGAKCVLEQSLK